MRVTRALGVGGIALALLGGGLVDAAASEEEPSPKGGGPSPEFDLKVRRRGGEYRGANSFAAAECTEDALANKNIGAGQQAFFDVTVKNRGDGAGQAVLEWDFTSSMGTPGKVAHFRRNGERISGTIMAAGLPLQLKPGKSKTVVARLKWPKAVLLGSVFGSCYLEQVQGDHATVRISLPA